MNETTIFHYGEQEIRTLLIEEDPWWVLVDVCRTLDIENSRNVARRLDEDEKMTVHLTDGHSGKRGGAQKLIVINESGLYSVIFRSNKPEAKAFKRWITRDVLPALRENNDDTASAPSVDNFNTDEKHAVQIFENPEFGRIRTLEEDGKVLFCGKDVAAALGYSNTKEAIIQHCPGVVKRDLGVQTGLKADGSPAIQQVEMSFIPEGDVYRLIAHSRLPAAVKFERWVFDDVLPTIRKTGRYEALTVAEPPLQPSAETGLQRVGLIIRAAEHKAVPQNEQLRLLDIAIKSLTGTGIDFTPARAAKANLSTVSLMDLPETTGVIKKGKTKRGRGYAIQYFTLSEAADAARTSAAEFDAFATERGLKSSFLYGEWTRVNTPQGDAREFLYTKEAIAEYAQRRKNKNA